MTTLTRTEVHHLVVDRACRRGSRNRQDFRHLKQKLSKVEAEELFWGLLQAFLTPDTSYAYDVQALSARLLLCLNPPCPSVLEAVIHQTSPNYNLSVEELPWYLAKQFGADTLQAALENISVGIETDIPPQTIETFKYWLSGDWRQRAEAYCQEA
jgi:hypothetical protein